MTTLTIPSFSYPQTRDAFNSTFNMLVTYFQSQGYNLTDAQTDAGTAINMKGQGLSDAEIVQAILAYHQAVANVTANNVAQAQAASGYDQNSTAKQVANSIVTSSAVPATVHTPVNAVTPRTKTATKITIYSQASPGVWRVQLDYSDGSSADYSLSTANVNYWISQGAALVDQSNGAWGNPMPTSGQSITASTPTNPNQNVSFSISFFQGITKVTKYDTKTFTTTLADYQKLNQAVRATYGTQVVFENVQTTTAPVDSDAASISQQVDDTITLIKNQPIPNQTTEGGTINGQSVTQPVKFDIILPNGQSKTSVVLSASDYIQLQNNVGLFSVENAQQGGFSPNTTYAALLSWMGSSTAVPTNTGNLKTGNSASNLTDPTKTNVIAQVPPKVTKVTIFGQADQNDWRVTLTYSDNSTKDYTLSTANVSYWISQGAALVDQSNGAWAKANPSTNPQANASNPAQDVLNSITVAGNTVLQNIQQAASDVTGTLQKLANPSAGQADLKTITDAITGAETQASNLISSASSQIQSVISKLQGNPPNATDNNNAPSPNQATNGQTTAPTATVTSLVIDNQIDSSNWRVSLTYSDSTTKDLVLSTSNIQSYIAQGVSFTDLTGLWNQTQTQNANNAIKQTLIDTIVSKAKKYALPITLGIAAVGGIGIAASTSRKRGITQNV